MEQAVSDPDALVAEAEQVLAAGPDAAMLGRLAEAWRAHPTHAGVTRLLADGLRLAGQRDQAVAAYAAALALDAMSFEAWFGMAAAQVARGAFAVARDALVLATARLLPDDQLLPLLRAELGAAEESSGAYEGAALCYVAAGQAQAAVRVLGRRPGDAAAQVAALLAGQAGDRAA